MTHKKALAIQIIILILFVLGFVLLGVSAYLQDTADHRLVNILGWSALGAMGISVLILLICFGKVIVAETDYIREKMQNQSDAEFFSTISLYDTPYTLEERFIQAGFSMEEGYLHKRSPSLAKDYINYYVGIANEENISEYFNKFCEKIEGVIQSATRYQKHNIYYIFFFNRTIAQEERAVLKDIIADQYATRSIGFDFDVYLPIIYDTANQKYITKAVRGRFSYYLLDIAVRVIYKMLQKAE